MNKKTIGGDRYVSGTVTPFDQRNEVFKRSRWDEEVMKIGEKFRLQSHTPRDKPGYTLEDMAFLRAGFALETQFARGNQEADYGLYAWDSPSDLRGAPEVLKHDSSDPLSTTQKLKRVARFFGASLIGVAELDRRWLYSRHYNTPPAGQVSRLEGPVEIPEDHRHVISLAFEMDYETIKYSPTHIAAAAASLAYSNMAYTTYLLAHYIRCLGYHAIPSGNDTGCNVPIAIDAGLGELSRMGILITPQYGPRVRLSKIITNLPLVADTPIDFGVWKFCQNCLKCASNCPSQAISRDAPTDKPINISNRQGVHRWPVDGVKCFEFWSRNGATCSICIRTCPFNKTDTWFHSAVRWGIKHEPWLNPFFINMDGLLGYGSVKRARDYWT